MSDTIILRGIAVELTSDLGRAFVADACRAGESVIDDSTLMEKVRPFSRRFTKAREH
jgi:hypothetical protein